MAFLTEADTCRRYVLPKLYAAGWIDEQISEQKQGALPKNLHARFYRENARRMRK